MNNTRNTRKSTRKMSLLVLLSLGIMFFSTLACKNGGKNGPCDLTGPNTQVTTCIAGEVINK